ncbi:MAG: hypothetical protein EXR86_01355 [Gammaproteobacteria bacterium]|nr:hypothetical protein [Gammaproteobacteria bacterium]
MKPIVFLGPSLPRATAAAILNAEYLPPAAAGDVLVAARRRPTAVVLIDGYFARVPAVWHKELLFALAEGLPVYGASSMGALRAAELQSFGMIGVGTIFERFRDGELVDDDEVAVLHAPEAFGYRALSEAMVNLRDGLAQAVSAGVIESAEQAVLVTCGKTLFYSARTWPQLTDAGVTAGLEPSRMERLTEWVRAHEPNSKRDDAIAVLTRVNADLKLAGAQPPVNFVFERTLFWERLVDHVDGRAPTKAASSTVTALAKLQGPGHWRMAILRYLLRAEARRRDWQVEPATLIGAVEDFRRDRGLLEAEAFGAWLNANEVDEASLNRLAQDDLLLTELVAADARGVEQALIDELKSNAAWKKLVTTATAQNAATSELGTEAPLPQEAGLQESDLIAWYVQQFGPFAGDLVRHARALGFADSTDFLVALTRAHLAR